MENNAVLLITCPDHKGIVADVSQFLYFHNANIIHADQHKDYEQNLFFMRVEWNLDEFDLNEMELKFHFMKLAVKHKMKWQMRLAWKRIKTAIFVSKQDHCLADLLYRYSKKELNIDIGLIISNHLETKKMAEIYKIPFLEFSRINENKENHDRKILLLLEKYRIELIILARYMQILNPEYVKKYPNKIINIHHSFLPAFIGANPYKKAYDRGVKIIGATSHYVTDELDKGPIIEQDILRVTHRDSVQDLIRKGKDLERMVLSRAVQWHAEEKILVYSNKTVVFS
ncbi:MAG: Formyltetrahydrofolate deformylase [Candidatus Roizmanbacteria bacterium GW2011_GWA2_36_23]|uniref:Formyltetrahydrofolate deformylase n=1 Tax=Candidatus Roizmanbacteria bacterium GW2011_GWA2_36_23 TaxID=1618480 RepID=A0A0G0E5I9_9BACT|nr:MAG: Formyltetrahydrofolate deformylase [Candidatus Roizmanbacteria bacterium GW2011_GWA2_36_23]